MEDGSQDPAELLSYSPDALHPGRYPVQPDFFTVSDVMLSLYTRLYM